MSRPLSAELWFGEGIAMKAMRAALAPASWLYSGCWAAYLLAYRLGFKRPLQPHRPVICIGNLVAGGSGKTPLTLFVVDCLRELGLECAVSCSGYGSPASTAACHAPEGALDAREWGDEPSMIRWLRPKLPLIVGRDRVRAARLCHERHPDAVLVLDDGYQHLPLAKDLTIVVDPDSKNRMCFPAGPYREPRRRLNAADIVIPGRFTLKRSPPRFMEPSGRVVSVAEMRAAPVSVLCAIGAPQRFVHSLAAVGLSIGRVAALRDHDRLDAGNLLAELPPDHPVVVTAKDWVKLTTRDDAGSRRIIVAVEEVEAAPADEFKSVLAARINEIRAQAI